MLRGPRPLRRGGRLNWLLLPLSRGLRVCLSLFFFPILTFLCFFRPLASRGGGRLHWLYCCYLGGWGPETTLDHFCLSNVWSAVRLDFGSVGHVRQFSKFECFGSWSPGGVAHVDITFSVSTIVPAIHHHRIGTPGQAGASRPTARATLVVVIMARGRGS